MIMQGRQDLKVHYFQLSQILKDVELQARSTERALRSPIRRLGLRKTYEDAGKLTPVTELGIWKYEVKSVLASLERSQADVKKLVAELKKLQENGARTQDNL
jgi:hypothetical protein